MKLAELKTVLHDLVSLTERRSFSFKEKEVDRVTDALMELIYGER